MRGKGGFRPDTPRFSGITPAYAGKSLRTGQRLIIFRDHPRLCGEKRIFASKSKRDGGSPPPMRGKGEAFLAVGVLWRITPAYAGKSRSADRWSSVCEDHPRLCGEKLHKRHFFHTCKGSPPPMRGKVLHSFVHHLSTRITPAYAGKSLLPSSVTL